MSVVVAAAAVAAAAAESQSLSALTKLVSRPLLSWGWVGVGVSVGLGGMPPVRKLWVARFRWDTLGWAELFKRQ